MKKFKKVKIIQQFLSSKTIKGFFEDIDYCQFPLALTSIQLVKLSDRSAAAVATAVLQDVGIVTKESSVQVIDKNKLRRARENVRHKIMDSINYQPLNAIYFDGRKDKTLTIKKKDGRSHRKTLVEEHISLVQEPGSEFLGYTMPSSESAKDLV